MKTPGARHLSTAVEILAAALFIAAVDAGTAVPAAAQAKPTVTVEQVSCLRFGDNQVFHATALAEPPGGSGRLYFQWNSHGGYYWVDLISEGPGRYWGVPPKPETRNTEVSYYATLLDAGGREVGRSQLLKSKVTADCVVKLTPQQFGTAQNLVVGETLPNQSKNRVMGFLCDGIVTRVDPDNVKRSDEICRVCSVVWWAVPKLLAPALVGAAPGISQIIHDPPQSSPSVPQ
jgi:hypothetical protein